MYEALIQRLREIPPEAYDDEWEFAYDYQQAMNEAANAIAELSKKRKTGKWIYPSDVTGFGRCSECKALWDHSLITNKYFKICPRCGSYNRGDEDV